MVILLAVLMGTTGVLCIVGAAASWKNGVTMGPGGTWETAGVFSYILHVIFGLLMLAAVAPTSMAEERQRGSLDILAATALSTRAIVVGKWLGTFRFAAFMAVGPGLLALAMATGESKSSYGFGPGLPPEYYQEISLGARIFGVGVVVATILSHGALITSIGLALAVWIKRQSRAIAFSVGLFVLVTAAWPIFASIIFSGSGWRGQSIASLSPVVACVNFLNFFGRRWYAYAGEILWWASFWAVEVFIVAMGLLCLTVRTFDVCFDRIPDRPWRVSLRTIVVTILAGMIGAGSLVGAVSNWSDGAIAHDLDGPTTIGILAYSFLVAIGLVLIAVETAMAGRRMQTTVPDKDAGLSTKRLILGRAWKSFRLVLLLAIGPAVLAMALSTAPWKPLYQTKTSTNVSGPPVVSYELITEHVPRVGEVGPGHRMMAAGLWVVTILVHGAAAIGVSLALTTVKRWSRRTLAIAAGFAVLVVLVVPLFLDMITNDNVVTAAMWNFVVASDALLGLLICRLSFSTGDILWCVLIWDVVNAVITIGLLWWTIRIWQRQILSLPEGKAAIEIGDEVGDLIVETALIGD